MLKKISQFTKRARLQKSFVPVVAVLLFAVIGTALLLASHALTPTANVEVESATVGAGGCPTTVSDSAASGGQAVRFKACASGAVKPVLTGGMDRGGDWLNCIETSGQTPLPVTSCYNQQITAKPYLHAQTFEIDWSFIEPSQGVYNWQPIDDAVAAVASHGMRMRLKVQTGVYSPAWAKTVGGAAVPFQNNNTYLNGEQTVPRYWTPAYKTAYNTFMAAMAARYDDNPTVAEVETCSAGLVSCETFLIFANDKTASDGLRNGQHLYDAGFTDALHMQAIQDDINFMTTVWHKTRIQLTTQPFHTLGTCPGNCGDAGGVPAITYDFVDGNHIAETPAGGNVTVTGLSVLVPAQAEFFHTGLGPKEVGGTAAQPTPDANTLAVYNYLFNANGVHNRSNHAYAVPLQTETYGRMDVAWASALDFGCNIGAIAVELPHGYSAWEKLSGSWNFSYPSAHTDTSPLTVLTDADACYQHNATLL